MVPCFTCYRIAECKANNSAITCSNSSFSNGGNWVKGSRVLASFWYAVVFWQKMHIFGYVLLVLGSSHRGLCSSLSTLNSGIREAAAVVWEMLSKVFIVVKFVCEVKVVDQQLYNVSTWSILFPKRKQYFQSVAYDFKKPNSIKSDKNVKIWRELWSTYHAARSLSWNLPMIPFELEMYGISHVFLFQIS